MQLTSWADCGAVESTWCWQDMLSHLEWQYGGGVDGGGRWHRCGSAEYGCGALVDGGEEDAHHPLCMLDILGHVVMGPLGPFLVHLLVLGA